MRKIIISLSTAAALFTLGSAAAAQASVAGNTPHATPACGAQCFDLSSLVLGPHAIQNAYIHGDTGTGGKVGQKVNLRHASNSRPNEDFTGARVGDLDRLLRQPDLVDVLRLRELPGHLPGVRVNLVTVRQSDQPVRRHRPAQRRRPERDAAALRLHRRPRMWVGDLRDSVTDDGSLYTPWVNASDPNFSHPLVLTVDTGTFLPENQLKVQRLNLLSNHTVADSQEFTIDAGPAA